MHRLTEGPILRTMVMFSLPVLGGNVLGSLSSSVNAFWVGRALGETAVAATANANIIMMFLLGSVFGISMAANLLVAQAVGAGDESMIKRVMGSSFIFFLVLSGALTLVGMLATPQILALMGTPDAARAEAIRYLRIIFLAMPFLYFFAFIQMAQRGAGDSKTPFYFMVLATVLGVVLNPIMIVGFGPVPALGIAGSAWATLLSQAIGLGVLVFWLYWRESPLVLRWSELGMLKPEPELLRALIFKGLPMGLQMLVISSAAIVMMGLVNAHGVTTSAAYGAATQVWTYVQMPAMAMSAAVSSMAAQNVGAGRWDRVGRITWTGVWLGLVSTAVMTAIIYASDTFVLGLFLPTGSAAIAEAHHINLMVMWSFVMFSATFVLFGVVRSTGAVFAPLIILGVSMWLVRIPFAQFLAPWLGADAIWLSFPLGTALSTGAAIWYYRYGKWREAKLLGGEPGQAADTGLSTPFEPLEPELIEAENEAQHAGRQRIATPVG